MNQPLVSILLPAYNAQLYLKEAITSILNQTYKNFELIVIDDGSTDETSHIIQSFKDKRIRYYRNKKNLKLIQTLNLGLNLCNGMYIARMDSDDIALPHRIEKQVAFLSQNTSIGIVGCNILEFGETKKTPVKYPIKHNDIFARSLFKSPFCHPSVIIRAEILHKCNLKYEIDYLHAEDYVLWLKLLKQTKGANIPEILLLYRSHSMQVSEAHRISQTKNAARFAIELLETNLQIGLCNEEKVLFCNTLFSKKVNYTQSAILLNIYKKIIIANQKFKYFPVNEFSETASRVVFHKIEAHKLYSSMRLFQESSLNRYYKKGSFTSLVKNYFLHFINTK